MHTIVADATIAIITRTGGKAKLSLPRSEGHRDSEVAGVVRQHVVIDSQVEPDRVPGPEGAGFSTNEEILVAIADAPDERGRGPVGKWAARIEWRIALAFCPIAAVASPAGLALRREKDLLTRPYVDTGIGPLIAGRDHDLTLTHPARRSGERLLAVAIPAAAVEPATLELDSVDVIAGDPNRPSAPTGTFLELDLAPVHTEELALQAPAVVHDQGVGAKERRCGNQEHTCER